MVSNANLRDRENFSTLARSLGLDVWDLIAFNFPGSRHRPDVVTWYLYEKMGCREVTGDHTARGGNHNARQASLTA